MIVRMKNPIKNVKLFEEFKNKRELHYGKERQQH